MDKVKNFEGVDNSKRGAGYSNLDELPTGRVKRNDDLEMRNL